MYVIGLLGKAGSGKTTAARWLVEQYEAQRVSFAYPLKELARDLLPWSDKQLYGTQAEKEEIDPRYGFSSRTFLQRLGEGVRRHVDPLAWVRAAERFMHEESARSELVVGYPMLYVIDDVRYRNEVEAICRWNGLVIKLVCPDAPTSAQYAAHASESEIDEVYIADEFTITSPRTPGSVDLLAKLEALLANPQLAKDVPLWRPFLCATRDRVAYTARSK